MANASDGHDEITAVIQTSNGITEVVQTSEGYALSNPETNAAEIISKMSEYQFIAVVQNEDTEPITEEVINENGETVVEYSYQHQDESVSTSVMSEVVHNQPMNIIGYVNNQITLPTTDVAQPQHSPSSHSQSNENQEINFSEKEIKTITIRHDKTSAPSNDDTGSIRSLLLPLGMKIPGGSDYGDDLNRTKKRMKSSLFIGYSTEAANTVRDFEDLKKVLNINSNAGMLSELIRNYKQSLQATIASSAQQAAQNANSIDLEHSKVDTGNGQVIIQVADEEMNQNQHDMLQEIIAQENQGQIESEISNSTFSNQQQQQQQQSVVNTLYRKTDETPTVMTNVLGLAALNIKTIQLSKKYLEFISKDDLYICGFIDSAEKLDEFLKLFRLVTGSSFSIRRSKVKVNDDPEPEEKPLRKYKPGYLGKGQIKWEKNIGIPPIPFTGIPFTTEGSTTYQCIYGPKRNNRPKEVSTEEDVTSNLMLSRKRTRNRESKKKDCPAHIHIRSIHRFTAFSCLNNQDATNPGDVDNVQDSYTNKCQRGVILAKLRESIINGQVEGEQGFWIRLPLPEVHQNHSLGPFAGTEAPLNEQTILEMKDILQHAAIRAT